MADTPVSPLRSQESATTREEMDFDDTEHEQETGRVSPLGHETLTSRNATKSPSPKPRVSFQDPNDDAPPPPNKPPRPLSAQQQAENTLIEAFPSIDTKVVKAVLMASGGKVEPAFNALLGMSDPSFHAEEPTAPPQPPRSAMRQPRNQVEADEMYARQLAEQFNAYPERGQNTYNQREPGRRGPNQQRPLDDPDRSFFDDDLPEIGRNIQQGFQETQKKLNSWFTTFKKKLDGEDDEDDLYSGSFQHAAPRAYAGRQNFGSSQSDQLYGIRKSAEAQRRSTEAQRYDADPHEFGDDALARLELRDDEAPPPMPPRTSSRQPANPNLFKPQPKPPQSGPVDEVDAAERKSAGQDPDKAKKWQPLTSVAPHPEDDNDPFSVGDDDDETSKDKTEDLRKEDTARLKEAARSSISAGSSGEPAKTLEEAPRKGSIDQEAAELLKGAK